jgi:FixJ family two-component response regulator
MEVLALLGQNLTNKEIAEELAVSPGTVKTLTLNIYRYHSIRGYRRRQEDLGARRNCGASTSGTRSSGSPTG